MNKEIYNKLLSKEIILYMNEKKAKPNKSIIEHTDDLLEVLELLFSLGYIKYEIYELVKIACVYHDIGKINGEFQKRIKNKKLKFNESKEIVHNILSLYFIDERKFENKENYLVICNAVMKHHDYCDEGATLREKSQMIENLLS